MKNVTINTFYFKKNSFHIAIGLALHLFSCANIASSYDLVLVRGIGITWVNIDTLCCH